MNAADVTFAFLTFSTTAFYPTLSGLVKQVLVNQIIRKEWVPKECSSLAAREEYWGINQNRTGKVAVFCGKIGKIMGKNSRQRKGTIKSQLTHFSQKYLYIEKTTKGQRRRNKQKVKKNNRRLNGGSREKK